MSKFVNFHYLAKLKQMMKVDCNVASFPLLKGVTGRGSVIHATLKPSESCRSITGSTAIEEIQQGGSRFSYGIIYI